MEREKGGERDKSHFNGGNLRLGVISGGIYCLAPRSALAGRRKAMLGGGGHGDLPLTSGPSSSMENGVPPE